MEQRWDRPLGLVSTQVLELLGSSGAAVRACREAACGRHLPSEGMEQSLEPGLDDLHGRTFRAS